MIRVEKQRQRGENRGVGGERETEKQRRGGCLLGERERTAVPGKMSVLYCAAALENPRKANMCLAKGRGGTEG